MSNHDVHHFASGVVLIRADPAIVTRLCVNEYDRGKGIILVERGTGRVRLISGETKEILKSLGDATQGFWLKDA